jgi:micrococcal nuclease
MTLKSLGWTALCVCIGAVTVTAFSPGSQPTTNQAHVQPPAVSESTPTILSVTGGSPGGYASVEVRTNPGADCSIRYVTPHGTISRAAGLVNQTADSDGNVSWTWKIGSHTEPGTGSVTVTCNGSSATTAISIGQ